MSVIDRLLHASPWREDFVGIAAGGALEFTAMHRRSLAAVLLSMTIAMPVAAQSDVPSAARSAQQSTAQSTARADAQQAAQSAAQPAAHVTDDAVPTLGHYPEPIPGAAKQLSPDPAFAAYPQYRGSLAGRAIVLRMGEKPRAQQGDDDAEPGHLNGEYQYLPNGPVVLIAGSRDGNTLTLEESDDGTRISGQWVGFFAADGRLSGERMNNDESDPVPVALRAVGTTTHAPNQGRP